MDTLKPSSFFLEYDSFRFGFCFLTLLFLLVIWPYFQAEILTFTYQQDLQIVWHCQNLKSKERLNFAKIVEFPTYQMALVFCVYENKNQNSQIRLVRRQNSWFLEFATPLEKEGNFYWPMYF